MLLIRRGLIPSLVTTGQHACLMGVETRQETCRRMETARHLRGGYSVVVVLAGILLVYLVSPVLYFFFFYAWPQTDAVLSDPVARGALITSVLSATVTSGITALLGIPLGYVLARWNFPGRQALILLVYL